MKGKAKEQELVLAGSRIPEELAEFLSRDTYSLMIKGESGTGKTILALSILKFLMPLENVLFISTRTSPLQLFEYYPWIAEIFGSPVAADQGNKEGWETLVDSRLDEPNAVFEHITNALMDRQAPIVVIDSWEALGESMRSEALRTDLKVLESWRERAGARFIFVGEDPASSPVDHLVEGVVLLREKTIEARRVREMLVSKLRGVEIQKPSHFFTLDGGQFRSFPEYSMDDYEFRNPLPVALDRPLKASKRRVPTGYGALDAMLKGGFPAKSVSVLSLGDGVDPKVGLVFLAKLVQDWTQNGGQVVLEDPLGVSPGFLRQYSRSFAGGRVVGPSEARPGAKRLVLTSNAGRRETEVHAPELTVVVEQGGARKQLSGGGARLGISLEEGTLFVRGEVPRTPFFGVVPGGAGGNPQIQIEPVV